MVCAIPVSRPSVSRLYHFVPALEVVGAFVDLIGIGAHKIVRRTGNIVASLSNLK
jgi:hypothetical protein